MSRLLLCTDLDRTLLPNGQAPESARARQIFTRLAAHPLVKLVYVTGRDPGLVAEAIATWKVPDPDLMIANVGTTIAARAGDGWTNWARWDETLAADWEGNSTEDLKVLLKELPGLTLQEASRQAAFKLSYYTVAGSAGKAVSVAVKSRLDDAGVRANVIWSLDDATGTGLLDVLPAAATKRSAIEFVMAEWSYGLDEVVFSGDSGNDFDVLASPIPAVLVANASDAVRGEVLKRSRKAGWLDYLHCAQGGILDMNGNYAAGILEGVLHFHPEWSELLEEMK